MNSDLNRRVISLSLVWLVIVACAGLVLRCTSTNTVPEIPLSESELRQPGNAIQGLTISDGLQARLFAAEPLIHNPTNMDIDHRGRVWVTEGINYRPWANPDNSYQDAGDRIVILEDSDGDGEADQRTVFYQGTDIDVALGICVLQNRVLVSAAPNIFLFTDTDGDDKADTKEILFSGISHPQNDHSVHAMVFGPDGRLYFNFGNAGGQLMDRDGNPVLDREGNVVNDSGNPFLQGMAFRCDLDGSNIEVLGHNFRNNYELAVDSYGTVWQSDNDDDGNKSVRINYVMEYGNFGYTDEYSGAGWSESRPGMSDSIPERHWHQNDPGVVPNLLITGSGSPAGITAYEGDLLPHLFYGQLIHAEAGPGVTRAYLLKEQGAGYSAVVHPILARDRDSWHRPSDVCVAPDGSLFIADWYDPGVGGNWAGDSLAMGRIFRVAPDVSHYKAELIAMETTAGAVEALKSPNIATRYLAWVALAGAGDAVEIELAELFKNGRSRHRARALWLLARLENGYGEYIIPALADSDPDIRMTAIRAARQHSPLLLPSTIKTVLRDPSPQVRREAAIALREVDPAVAPQLWAELAGQHDGTDRWYLEALGIAAHKNWDNCLNAWLTAVDGDWNTAGGRDIIWRSRAGKTIDFLAMLITDPKISADQQVRYLRAIDFQNISDKNERLTTLLGGSHPEQAKIDRMLLTRIDAAFAKSSERTMVTVREILPQISDEYEFLELVKNLDLRGQSGRLFDLALNTPNHEVGVQAARLIEDWEGMARFRSVLAGDDEGAKLAVATVLANVWGDSKNLLHETALDNKQSLALRRRAITSLGTDWGWQGRMRKILDIRQLPAELQIVAATRLLGSHQSNDQMIARACLEATLEPAESIPSLADLVSMDGNLQGGKEAFSTFCSTCHQVNQSGIAFGPDLSEIGNKLSKESLYMSIVNPDAGISHGFGGVQLTLKNERNLEGYLISETVEGVTLRMMGGIEEGVRHDQIAQRRELEHSLMTPNLHLAMGREQLVDVVAYLGSLRNPRSLAENPFQGQINYER